MTSVGTSKPDWTIHRHHHHFEWDRRLQPVLSASAGDTLLLEVNDASAGRYHPGANEDVILACMKEGKNPVTGPVFVNGAEPGDALIVEFLEFVPSGHGWTAIQPGFGLLPELFSAPRLHHWRYDALAREPAAFGTWAKIPLRPFAGTVGTALAGHKKQPTLVPTVRGGNIDVKQATAGAKLYLPVEVPGALLSIGDTHAAQGDGEVCGSAIESAMDVLIRVDLIKSAQLSAPRISLPVGPLPGIARLEVTMGIGPELFEAAREAVARMIDLICTETGMPAEDAYMLCSVAGDLHVSEIVNRPNFVVSFHLPFDIFS